MEEKNNKLVGNNKLFLNLGALCSSINALPEGQHKINMNNMMKRVLEAVEDDYLDFDSADAIKACVFVPPND